MINSDRPEQISAGQEVQVWQRRLVLAILRSVAVVAPLALIFACYQDILRHVYWTIPLYWLAYIIVLLLTFWKRVPYRIQAWTIIVLFYALSLIDFVTDGRGGSARIFMVMMPFTAGILLSRRVAIGSVVVALLTAVAVAWVYTANPVLAPPPVLSDDLAGWVSNIAVMLLLGIYIIASVNYLLPRLVAALNQSRVQADELEAQRAGLEGEVKRRTVELERRSTQLATAAEVAREAVAIQDVEQLLVETTRLISQRFGFYHTGIFLVDRTRQYAVLRAASSTGGERMIARGHQLRIGQEGIVGQVTATGQSHVALDVGADAVFFDNPDLPETRSEIALPLWARGEIIGALDVQSREPAAFGPDDVASLQTLADQVAIAISNARLFEQLQHSLEAERQAFGELSRRAWQTLSRQRSGLGRRYDPHGVLPPGDALSHEMKRALATGEPALGRDPDRPSVAIPVKIRGQIVGVLDARRPAENGDGARPGRATSWQEEEVALLETLADQLGAAIDSARLYQETQRRAARERLAAQVTARMRESLDLDTVMRTAVEEMRDALGLTAMTIRLAPAAADRPAAPDQQEAE